MEFNVQQIFGIVIQLNMYINNYGILVHNILLDNYVIFLKIINYN